MIRKRSVSTFAAAALALALGLSTGAPATAGTDPVATAAPTAAGVDVARTAVATASSTELDQTRFAAALANDGDPSTRWSSQYVDASWLRLAFAEPTPIHAVEIDWPNACARAYSLQTSLDGVTWTTVAERTAQATCPRTDELVLDLAEPVSFLRMLGAQRWSSYGYSISEIRVWNAPEPEPVPELPLIPQPVQVEQSEGEYELPSDARIEASSSARAAAQLLARTLRPSTGFKLPVVAADDSTESAIEIEIAEGLAPEGEKAEGYRLDVDADGVRIGAETAAGALNGVQTLRQLLPAWGESDTVASIAWTVPYVSIQDYPRFEHRGLMIDTARSFYTVDEVKRLIDSASPWKINRLHIHLTDDQGWRLTIDTPEDNPSGIDYSLLTEVSGATAMTYNHQGQLMGTELGHTGFYTKDDYREIVSYAAANGMTVIPEIDLPGHTNAALHAIPQLNSAGSSPKPAPGTDTAPAQGTGDVGGSTLDADNPTTYEFLSVVLRQVAELTPGQYLHIGGDEAHTTSHEDYVRMVDYANAQVADLGKTVVGWNEYAGTALPQDDAVVQFWAGGAAPVAAAVKDHGAEVILSPANKAYFPQKQDSRQPLGGTWACGGPCTLETAYNWNPATHLAGVGEQSVLGVEGAFWGEFIRGVDQAQFYSFPRLIALAEVGWTPQEQRNTASFLDRLGDNGPRLAAQGVNFFPTATVDWAASAAPRATVSKALNSRPGSAAQATVTLRWRIAAPATGGDVTARLVWDDGLEQEVPLEAAASTDIAAMTLNPVYTGETQRKVSDAGEHSARWEVIVRGEVVASSTVTVFVDGNR